MNISEILCRATWKVARSSRVSSPPYIPSIVQRCQVAARRRDSDHCPIELQLQLFGLPPMRTPAGSGQPLLQHLWRPSLQRNYARELADGEAAACIQRCQTAVQQGDLDAAEAHFCRGMQRAAEAAGAKRTGRPRPLRAGRQQYDAAFYDQECQAAKAAVRQLRRSLVAATNGELRCASNEYHSMVRRKKRAWQRMQLDELLSLMHNEPRTFWQRVNTLQTSMPLHLRDPQAWETYIHLQSARQAPPGRHLPASPPAAHASPVPSSAVLGAAARQLDAVITPTEVSAAMAALHNGRSAGAAAQPAEFLRYGVAPKCETDTRPPTHILAAPLAHLFTEVMRRGAIPEGWKTSVITPILKRGDPADTANYRPIAVGVPLVRLYANLLNRRLMSYLEGQGLRAPTQAGFRPHMSINHHLFTLQHLIDSSRLHRRPLFACFVDLTAAYDCVQRPLLWEALRRKGVLGTMLTALQGLYTDGSIAMKVGGRVGEPQPSLVGVRQGCPLSPTLFGVFMDGLHDHLAAHAPGCGVPLSDPQLRRIISHLMYADDIALMAAAPAELQHLIDALSSYCTAVGLGISATKSQTMTFHPQLHRRPRDTQPPTFNYNGHPLPTTDSYKYLGTVFTPNGTLGTSLARTKQRTGHAYHSLRLKLSRLDCTGNLFLQLHLFDAFVKSTACASCEVWGVHPTALTARKTLAKDFRRYLKTLCRLPNTVADDMLHEELERLPIENEWLLLSVNFWNSLCKLPLGSLHRDVLQDNLWVADSELVERRRHGNFTTGLRQAAAAVGLQLPAGGGGPERVGTAAVQRSIWDTQQQRWQQLDICPRTCTSSSVLCSYWRWFARSNTNARRGSARELYRQRLSPSRLRRFLRFRLSCTLLPVMTGRRRATPSRRMDRHCNQCDLGIVGDQRHVVFECTAVQDIRLRYLWLFAGNPSECMHQFMTQQDEKSVMNFIVDCLNRLEID